MQNKNYVIQRRGEIEVKGKGRMTTYFLERNTGVTEQQIMGLSDQEPGARQQDGQMIYKPGHHGLGLFAVWYIFLDLEYQVVHSASFK